MILVPFALAVAHVSTAFAVDWAVCLARSGVGLLAPCCRTMEVVISNFRSRVLDWLEGQLARGTQVRYSRARDHFAKWTVMHGMDVQDMPTMTLDIVVAKFVLEQKEDDDADLTRQGCLDLMASLQTRAQSKLPLTHRVMRAWAKEQPPVQAEAMPKLVAYAMVTVLGSVLREPHAAAAVLLCFSGCLRIGEALGLTADDVFMGNSVGGRPTLILVLRSTKRSFDQRVVIWHPLVVAAFANFSVNFHRRRPMATG